MAESNDNDPPRNRSRDSGRNRDDDDDRPRRRRDRDDDDDDDDRPRRRRREGGGGSGGTSGVMIVAIIGGVLLLGCVVIGILIALLLPAVSKVRGAAARLNDQNNMKQLSIGMMNYHDSHGKLPPAQEKVSWRVYILPYIEQAALSNQFKMDESWDSPANRRHANTQVKVFLSASDPPETVETHYRAFVGPNTLYEPGNPPLPFKEVKDGIAATIFIVEARETVPWPQPRELEYDRNSPLPAFGILGRNGFNVAMLDGSVKFVTDKTSADAIRGGIEPNDGRAFDP